MFKVSVVSVVSMCLLALMTAVPVSAKMITKDVEYKDGDTVLQGYLAYDDAFMGKRPGVLIIHEWNGLGKYVRRRAGQIASLGYIAFCADIYGKGIRPKTQDESSKTADIYKNDRQLMRSRATAGLREMNNQANVDQSKLAVMGYCFGGGVALELARSGADVLGVVCFHGNLDTPNPADAKNIKAKILVLQGADDTYTRDSIPAFKKEMEDANVNYKLIEYPGAVHGFTNPRNGNDNSKGIAYNKKADERSWQAMKDFYEMIFK